MLNNNLNQGKSWPTIKRIKNFDRKIGESKQYKQLDNLLNKILVLGCLILLGVELWNVL